MAKKVRRAKKKRQQKKEAAPVAVEESVAVVESEEVTEHQATVDQFQLDYAYVVKDLRRVLILAAVMFALLIALNLLLR